jgi:hypothetical protein
MQPSTKKIDFDLDPLVKHDLAYVTTFVESGRFLSADTPKDLETEYFKDRDGFKTEFLVSTSKDLISEEVKVLIPISARFYHFFIDSMTAVLKIHKHNPGALFVLYLEKELPNKSYEDFLELLFKVLDSVNVRYRVISPVKGMDFAPTYQFKNYALIDDQINIHDFITFIDLQYTIDLVTKCTTDEQDEVVEPFRKIYLTRGGAGSNIGTTPDDYQYYRDDLRIYEEAKLEKFFADLGYEIVEPETEFDSLTHQIRYMREVKTLVSVTASGLANMMFMQNNQTVIEIQSEIVEPYSPDGYGFSQALHSHYQSLSFMNEHIFISIPTDRHPAKVIEALTKDALSYVL